MLKSDIQGLFQGQTIARKPAGRGCRVERVDREKERALVKDLHISAGPFWVKFSTLLEKWRIPPGNA